MWKLFILFTIFGLVSCGGPSFQDPIDHQIPSGSSEEPFEDDVGIQNEEAPENLLKPSSSDVPQSSISSISENSGYASEESPTASFDDEEFNMMNARADTDDEAEEPITRSSPLSLNSIYSESTVEESKAKEADKNSPSQQQTQSPSRSISRRVVKKESSNSFESPSNPSQEQSENSSSSAEEADKYSPSQQQNQSPSRSISRRVVKKESSNSFESSYNPSQEQSENSFSSVKESKNSYSSPSSDNLNKTNELASSSRKISRRITKKGSSDFKNSSPSS